MRILLVGAGGVGTAFARIAARRRFAELVIADYDLETRSSRWLRDFLPQSTPSCRTDSFPSSSMFTFRPLTWMSVISKRHYPRARGP